MTPSGFRNLLAHSRCLRLLTVFQARSAHGVHALQSFVPSTQPYAVSDAVYPLDVGTQPSSHKPDCRASSTEPAKISRSGEEAPRLQGVAPRGSPPLPVSGLDQPGARSSPGISPLQGVHPRPNDLGLRPSLPSQGFTYRATNRTAGALLRVSIAGEIGCSLSRIPTLMGFIAF